MRCLIVIALCFVLANANYMNKDRFQRLLSRYQNQNENQHRYQQDEDEDDNEGRYQTQNRYSQGRHHQNRYEQQDQDMLGSDGLDEHMDEMRRGRMSERDQCPRDTEQFGGRYQDDEEDQFQGQGRNRYSQESSEDEEDQDQFQGQGQNRYSQENNQEDEETSSGPRSELMREVKDANVKLAARLYKQSRDEKDDKNTVVSPLSIQLALVALNQGARGNTKKQIGRVIAGRLQKQERKQIFRTLVRHLKKGQQQQQQNEYSSRQQQHSTQIHPVTGIFITKTTRAQQMFVQTVKRNLGANVKQCDFQRQPQQCRQQINRFIAEKTQGKINHIVPQDAITDNTKMILVNTLQLKAPWGRQMRQHQTKEAKFYPLDTKKVKIVEVMETQGRFKYYEDELVKIVGLPTEKKELTLYVIVPKDKDGLTDVEKMYLQDGEQLKELLKVTDQRVKHVGVQLPKFQIKHKIDVRRTLRKQGVTDAFDPQRADFSGITGVNQYEQDEQVGQQYEQEESSRVRRNPFTSRRHQFEDEMTSGNERNDQTENKLHLNKFIHQTTIKISENGITAQTGSGSPFEDREESERLRYGHQGRRGQFGGMENEEETNQFDEMTGFNRRERQQGQNQEQKMVKANRAFAFVVKHNPTGQLVLVGRVIDAAQKKVNNVQQTINNVDQL